MLITGVQHCCIQMLSQWRQQKLQESLRNSVLDEEAAAKFSTAAALAAKEKRKEMAKANYDKGLLAAVDEDKFRDVSLLLTILDTGACTYPA